MNGLGVLAAAALLVGCGGLVKYELPPTVAARIHASADLALRDYRRNPVLPDPYARAIYCVENETLLEYDAGAVDAGADIVCHPPPKPVPLKADPQLLCTDGFSCIGNDCSCFWRKDAGR
jgi:hypothetical protein